jgi:hypothetical protein
MSIYGGITDMGSGHNSPEAIMMYEQFARVGNSVNGQAYTRFKEADELQLIDVNGSDIYIGCAIPGTATTDTTWKIKKINTNNPISIKWADSSTLYNKKWDDRTTYSYS